MLFKIFAQCVSSIIVMVAIGVGINYLLGGGKDE
jgi:hypothetical protein